MNIERERDGSLQMEGLVRWHRKARAGPTSLRATAAAEGALTSLTLRLLQLSGCVEGAVGGSADACVLKRSSWRSGPALSR